MANDVSNFPTRIYLGGNEFANVTKIGFPQWKNDTIETTNVSSTAKEWISGGLAELTDFTFGVNYGISGSLISGSSIVALVTSGSKSSIKITFPTSPVTNWTFSGVITSFKMNDADAKAPDVLSAEISIKPSGAMTVS